jgi:uncharacterized protein YdeI (YjbR/CyaY-like superfamily)
MPGPSMPKPAAAPRHFENADAFRDWLRANAATATELLVGFHKTGSGRPCMTWPESVDEALCFGWIDGVRRRIDDAAYSIRFTPRKPGSIWSAVNIAKVARLQAEGRMAPAGEAAFARRTAAKSKVYAYEQPAAAALSAAETAALKQAGKAWPYFQSTPAGYRKVILHWVTGAKRPATRGARFAKLLAACRAGERLR